MKIIVKAKTKAKENKVERISQSALGLANSNDKNEKDELVIYKVSVKEAPIGGKANEAIIKSLAEYFDVARGRVELVSGQSSKQKVFEIS